MSGCSYLLNFLKLVAPGPAAQESLNRSADATVLGSNLFSAIPVGGDIGDIGVNFWLGEETGQAALWLEASQYLMNGQWAASLAVLQRLCYTAEPNCADEQSTGTVPKQLRKLIRLNLLYRGGWQTCANPAGCIHGPPIVRPAELAFWIAIERSMFPDNQHVKGLEMLISGELSAASYTKGKPPHEAAPMTPYSVGPPKGGFAGGVMALPDGDGGRLAVTLHSGESSPSSYSLLPILGTWYLLLHSLLPRVSDG